MDRGNAWDLVQDTPKAQRQKSQSPSCRSRKSEVKSEVSLQNVCSAGLFIKLHRSSRNKKAVNQRYSCRIIFEKYLVFHLFCVSGNDHNIDEDVSNIESGQRSALNVSKIFHCTFNSGFFIFRLWHKLMKVLLRVLFMKCVLLLVRGQKKFSASNGIIRNDCFKYD